MRPGAFIESLTELFMPELCAFCGEPVEPGRKGALCSVCHVKWQSEKDFCAADNYGLPAVDYGGPDSRIGCGKAAFLTYYNPHNHNTAAASLIFKLKRRATKPLLRFIAGEYAALLKNAAPMLFDGTVKGSELTVTWIPRRREAVLKYGYDHMELCAKELAGLCGFRAERLIVRTGKALEQKRLDLNGRLANAGSTMKPSGERLDGRTVILIDDLITTGASMRVGEQIILDSGARAVISAAIAASGRCKSDLI